MVFTSGASGVRKLVVPALASLAGAINGDRVQTVPAVWSTFYDIRRYGGLQILLRALLGGGSLVLSSAAESTGGFLIRSEERRVGRGCGYGRVDGRRGSGQGRE